MLKLHKKDRLNSVEAYACSCACVMSTCSCVCLCDCGGDEGSLFAGHRSSPRASLSSSISTNKRESQTSTGYIRA